MTLRLPAVLAFALALAGVSGCGGGSGRTGTITGRAVHAGKPMTGGSVTFYGKQGDELVQVSFPINPDGTYTATDIPYGDLKIGVSPPPPTAPESGPAIMAPAGTAAAKNALGQFTENGLEVPGDVLRGMDDARRAASASQGPAFPPEYIDPITSPLTFTLDKSNAEYEVIVP